jgi:hypothetical protein
MMMSLGLYVLNAADAAEGLRVEAHLPGCPPCQEELRRLGPLPGLLAGVPEDMLVPARPPGRVAGPPARAGSRYQITHVSATADLTATSWGTSIQLQVHGLPANVECRLVIRSRAGRTEVAGAWDAWQDGPVSIPASTSWRPSDIASLQVTTATRQLVTISGTQTTGGTSR